MIVNFHLHTVKQLQLNTNDVLYTHLIANNWSNYSAYYNKMKLDIYTQVHFLNLVNLCTINLVPIKNDQIQIGISFNNVVTKYSTTTLTSFREIAQFVSTEPVDIIIQGITVNLDTPCQLGNQTRITVVAQDGKPKTSIVHNKMIQSESKPESQCVVQSDSQPIKHSVVEEQVNTSSDMHSDSAELFEINRNIAIYKPVQQNQRIELSDDFFNLSGGELKYLIQQQSNYVNGLDKPLKTQSMRDKEVQEKLNKAPRTKLRFMMPDQYIIEIHFWSIEKMAQVYTLLDTVISNNNYELIALRVHYARNEKRHLFDLQLSPASLIHVKFEGKIETPKIVRKGFRIQTAQHFSISRESSDSSSFKDAAEKIITKIPKWMKKKK
eukprot:NODE_94_length_21515_cov_0.130417.p7 type:complete len:380 gc:universal NODE_94_length_21515_cov_0.130417:7843-6704(-)